MTWHEFATDKPKEFKKYIVVTDNGTVKCAWWSALAKSKYGDGFAKERQRSNVVLWMEIPEIPETYLRYNDANTSDLKETIYKLEQRIKELENEQ